MIQPNPARTIYYYTKYTQDVLLYILWDTDILTRTIESRRPVLSVHTVCDPIQMGAHSLKHIPQVDVINPCHIIMTPDVVFVQKKGFLCVVPPRTLRTGVCVLVWWDV